MVASDKLQAGACYFFVTYEDRDLNVPVVETLRFKNRVSENDSREASYVFERIAGAGDPQCRLSEDHLETVFEFDALVSEFSARLKMQRVGAPYEPRYCDD